MSIEVSEKEQKSCRDESPRQGNTAEASGEDGQLNPGTRKRYDREFFAEVGKRGGKIGGKMRAQRMTAQQRSESARKAVIARWKKFKLDSSVNSSS